MAEQATVTLQAPTLSELLDRLYAQHGLTEGSVRPADLLIGIAKRDTLTVALHSAPGDGREAAADLNKTATSAIHRDQALRGVVGERALAAAVQTRRRELRRIPQLVITVLGALLLGGSASYQAYNAHEHARQRPTAVSAAVNTDTFHTVADGVIFTLVGLGGGASAAAGLGDEISRQRARRGVTRAKRQVLATSGPPR